MAHFRAAGSERRKRLLVRGTCQTCIEGAKLGPGTQSGRSRTTTALLCATHHIRWVVPNVGVGEVEVKINAVASRRGGAQMAR
jgi:hypothetical protein